MPNLRNVLRRRPLIALIVLILLLAAGYTARALDHSSPSQPTPSSAATGSLRPSVGSTTPLSELPPQAARTVALIKAGGPFPYRQDGVVFGNAERRLPVRPRGYYHEYTVPTPGSTDRGTRRIVTGSGGQYYYSGDHYASFVAVDVSR